MNVGGCNVGGEAVAGGTGDGSGAATTVGRRCEDCGNQAKRECRYWRCRRCCNKRKLECQTHVCSTWVPTSFRRLRRLQQASRGTHPSSTSQQEHQNPSGIREVTSMATFHCCKVSSTLDGGRDHGDHCDDRLYEYAYRTSVSIGGHLFKGILYHQPPQNDNC
ncbi:Protein SHI RELATED SEQUENCE 3 [Linum grandiflorum]